MVLNVKDSNELEVVRFYEEEDDVFAAIDNRPLYDFEQRDLDLQRNHFPSRGFRVRQTMPTADANVTIEPGTWLASGITVTSYAGTSLAIPATGAGTIRIDLIWFDFSTGAHQRTAGTPGASGSGFAALTKPPLPSNTGGMPLAYVYVDQTPTPFSRLKAINTAGHIQDVRLGPGCPGGLTLLESVAANFLTDVASGNAGTSTKLPRADHRHPLNVDGTVPAEVAYPGVAGSAGAAATYARRDHVHPFPTLLTSLLRFFGAAFNPTYTKSVGDNTLTALSDVTNRTITIPANTFLNGIVIVATANLYFDSSGGGDTSSGILMRVYVDNTTSQKYLSAVPVRGSWTASTPNLGAPPLFFRVDLSSGPERTDDISVTVVGAWIKSGGNIAGGQTDFDPSQVTTVQIYDVEAKSFSGSGDHRISAPTIMVFGF